MVGSDGFRKANDPSNAAGEKAFTAGTQALPVDTNSLSPVEWSAGPQLESRVQPAPGAVPTPGTKFDKKAWMREYMREHRRGVRRRVAK